MTTAYQHTAPRPGRRRVFNDTDRKAMAFISEYVARNGIAPTCEEIGDACSMAADGARKVVKRLCADGYLTKTADYRKPRGIALTGKELP